ncbi:MAG: hypothetical protein HY225_02905 [Candidatus Vogelbacteria bacterium]|nr:hypothetical protein [Candidatus Vogelbacteria bacterium]
MESLFTHLGINWKLLLAQGANFFVLVLLLNYFLYKPLVNLINDRRQRIEQGLKNADDMDRKLSEIDELRKAEIMKGEREALAIIDQANKACQEDRGAILKTAAAEAETVKRKAEELSRRLMIREMEKMEAGAKSLLMNALSTAVQINPMSIDEKLINDAVDVVKSSIK